MKKLKNNKQTWLSLAVMAIALLTASTAGAQEVTTSGYANIDLLIKSAPQGGGQVAASTTGKGLKAWRDSTAFKQAVQVGDIVGAKFTVFYLYARPTAGNAFGGWYADADGDGQLDVAKDVLLSSDEEYFCMLPLDDDVTVYATEAEAKASGQYPPQETIFAYFTRGVMVYTSYYQGEGYANCGSVWIDKPVNQPGDQVTLRALANDGYQFEYWQDSLLMGNVVSRENPLTMTVKGGERLYAYFSAIDGPQVELPAEGGYRMVMIGQPWVMTDEAMKAGAHVVVLEQEDLVKTPDGKAYLDASKEDALIDVAQFNGLPSLVYGKGNVRFAYKLDYGMARSQTPLIRWSGDAGTTVRGELLYAYAWRDDLQAFVQCGNTDTFVNPSAGTTISIAPRQAYFSIPAQDLTDDEGRIPAIIALSPDGFDQAVAGIPGVTVRSIDVSGRKIYTLSGAEVSTTSEPGIYIINGQKVVVKN